MQPWLSWAQPRSCESFTTRGCGLRAAQDSLAKNQSTFATLPIADLLDENGVLKDLQRLGYVVEAPDDEPAEEPAEAP